MQPERQFANGLQVVRDVVAAFAVAAGGAHGQLAVLVGQRDGHAVDLQFDDVGDRLLADHLADALVELAQFVGVVGVVDRQHRQPMLDGRELVDRLAADALGGAVGRDQLGMAGLDVLQLLEELVELPVRDFGLGLDVVFVVVVVDEAAQFSGALCGRGHDFPRSMS